MTTFQKPCIMGSSTFTPSVCRNDGIDMGGDDYIYYLHDINDTLLCNYLKTVTNGLYIYCVIISMMINLKASVMGGWVRDTLSNKLPSDVDMYIESNTINNTFMIIEFVERLLAKLFSYIAPSGASFHSRVIEIQNSSIGYACHRFDVDVGNKRILTIDLNLWRNRLECTNNHNIDFVQNSLAFRYNIKTNGIVLGTGCDFKWFNTSVQAYIIEQPILLEILDLVIGFTGIYEHDPIVSIIKSFLGDEWQLIYGTLYTLWKSKGLFACHMSCGITTDGNIIKAQAIKNRCRKFKKRYMLRNTNVCCDSCCFNSSVIPHNTILPDFEERNNVKIKQVTISKNNEEHEVALNITIKQVTITPNYIEHPLLENIKLRACHNGGNYAALRKNNKKKVKYTKIDHLTWKQEDQLNMPNRSDHQLECMLNIRLSNKTNKSSKKKTYLGPNVKIPLIQKESGSKFFKKHSYSRMLEQCWE
jgi:hypothetical protein